MTIRQSGGTSSGGGGITLDDIPADAAVDVASLRTLGDQPGQALDADTADGLYDVAGAASSAVAGLDLTDLTVTGARVAARFRGTHASSTAYLRGDIVLVPGTQSDLRQASINHTSGAGAYSTANEFSSSNQWMPVTIPGFRGPWIADAWYDAGDHVIASGGTTIVQALYSHRAATYDSAKFAETILPTLPLALRADALLPVVGEPDLGPYDTHGLHPKRSRLRYPARRRLVTLEAPSDFASTSGAGSIDQDPDPVSPGGSVRINFPQVPIVTFTPAVDLTTNILRGPAKLTGATGGTREVGATPGTPKTYEGISGALYLEVSSDGFASGNYHRADIIHHNDTVNVMPDAAWWWTGVGPADWVAFGAGANLAGVNAIRIRCAGSATTLSLGWFEAVPNNTGKGKVVLWADDNYGFGWTTLAEKASKYGFPITLASSIGTAVPSQATQIQGLQLRRLTDFHGGQVATHAYTNGDHNSVTDPATNTIGGDALREQFMKSRHLQNAFGTHGGDDFAYFGNNCWLTEDSLRAVRQYMRSARRFISNARLAETLPPIDPHAMWCWGVGSSDQTDSGAAMIAYATKAAAQKGMAGFVWHNGAGPELDALLAWCNANRATVDVVTVAEALAPWTVAA